MQVCEFVGAVQVCQLCFDVALDVAGSAMAGLLCLSPSEVCWSE